MPLPQLRFSLSLLLPSLVVLAGCGGGQQVPVEEGAPAPEIASVPPDLVVARVNGEEIRGGWVNEVFGSQLQRLLPVASEDPEAAAEFLETNQRNLLEGSRAVLVDTVLMAQAAMEHGYEPDEEVLQNMFLERRQRWPSETAFLGELEKAGFTMESLRHRLTLDLLAQNWQVHVAKEATVTEEEAREYYEANHEDFWRPTAVWARHIGRGFSSASPTEEEKADEREMAEKALAEIESGRPFEDVAREYSTDPETAVHGGKMYEPPRGPVLEGAPPEMIPVAIQEVLFRLQPGETSGVFESPIGFHIIRVERREEERYLEFEEVEAAIKNSLLSEKRLALIQQEGIALREAAEAAGVIELVPLDPYIPEPSRGAGEAPQGAAGEGGAG
jgi:parvulin-like peptidyl-prolyl isomerase